MRAKLERFLTWKVREHESLEPSSPPFVSLRGTRLSTRQLRHGFAVWQDFGGGVTEIHLAAAARSM